MPQMPSGRHVGLDAMPLNELLENWHEDDARERLASIRSVEDVFAYVRILEFVPAAAEPTPALEQADGSLPMPPGLVQRDTGLRFSQWPGAFQDWSEEDRVAFEIFVKTRAMSFLASMATEAQAQHQRLTKLFFQRLEAVWMEAGVHPNKEPGWEDLPNSPDLDSYDILVALGQCRVALDPRSAEPVPDTKVTQRLAGIWSMACGALEWLPRAPDPLAATQEPARRLREGPGVDGFAPARQAWWRTQLRIECANLFNDATLEPVLMHRAPKAWGVIKTVALSTT